jgi:hypothetical protein
VVQGLAGVAGATADCVGSGIAPAEGDSDGAAEAPGETIGSGDAGEAVLPQKVFV